MRKNNDDLLEIFGKGEVPSPQEFSGYYFVEGVWTEWLGHQKLFYPGPKEQVLQALLSGRIIPTGYNVFFFGKREFRWGYFRLRKGPVLTIDYNVRENLFTRKVTDLVRKVVSDPGREVYLGRFYFGGKMLFWFTLSRKIGDSAAVLERD